MREISKKQFDAYCYSRNPFLYTITREVAWYEAGNRKLLGVILLDLTDLDFNYIILGRDTRRLFRCIDGGASFPTKVAAFIELQNKISVYANDENDLYPQGDKESSPQEILNPVVDENSLHSYFKILKNEPRFEAARNIIREIAHSFTDVDGNFIREFQTNGFNSRLWELYLHMYLYRSGFEFDRLNQSPDFCIKRKLFGYECFIEAVTANASGNTPIEDVASIALEVPSLEYLQNYVPMRFGSALTSKLYKKNSSGQDDRYWNKAHVQGKPFILAIHDFHFPGSMTWSRTALAEYLYGWYYQVSNVHSTPQYIATPIDCHKWEDKTIPSNFFSLPESENISAVLFTNAATITKFNRMGKLAGLGSENIKMIRSGLVYNPNGMFPNTFASDIDDPLYEESWDDALVMYHNPSANIPVDPYMFPDISHIFVDPEDGYMSGNFTDNHVLSSTTMIISPTGERNIDPTEPAECVETVSQSGLAHTPS